MTRNFGMRDGRPTAGAFGQPSVSIGTLNTPTGGRTFKNDLGAEAVREHLDYCPDTGIFRWKKSTCQAMHAGMIAGCVYKTGYRLIKLLGHRFSAHRLAWLYVHGAWPKELIDHIDGDVANNAISNLREATAAENNKNVPARGYSPVASGKFRATIRINRKSVHLGTFATASEAASAFVAASKKHHGEFSPFSGRRS